MEIMIETLGGAKITFMMYNDKNCTVNMKVTGADDKTRAYQLNKKDLKTILKALTS